MGIKNIQPKAGFSEIIADVVEKGPAREFQKFGKPGRVSSCKIKDETGQCTLSLWNEQVDMVNQGDRIRIANGWANEWQGEIQVSTGKNGTLEILGKSAIPSPAKIETKKTEAKTAMRSERPDEAEEEFI